MVPIWSNLDILSGQSPESLSEVLKCSLKWCLIVMLVVLPVESDQRLMPLWFYVQGLWWESPVSLSDEVFPWNGVYMSCLWYCQLNQTYKANHFGSIIKVFKTKVLNHFAITFFIESVLNCHVCGIVNWIWPENAETLDLHSEPLWQKSWTTFWLYFPLNLLYFTILSSLWYSQINHFKNATIYIVQYCILFKIYSHLYSNVNLLETLWFHLALRPKSCIA
jgi:hypothetical protein